ncbi:MAG: universal stress protein [Kiritimatiellae bacterium]|jgi:nucleotide-binding universal stress UspA family protein|nr:universal stress protein [Kiritimatiellia bacterium]
MSDIDLSGVNYQKILFCTDFSENAHIAFKQAVKATSSQGSEICLLHVIPEPDAQFWKGYIYEVGDMDSKAHNDIDKAILEQYQPLVPEGVSFRVEVKIGEVARSILNCIGEYGADLVVIGRQGHGAITSWLLGNVTEKVVRKAVCPVLVVPMKIEKSE